MLRKSAAILALLLTCFVPPASALGLGSVTVESNLNQPLRVRIEVLQLGDTRLNDVRIQVATPEDFIRFGIERATFLNNIRFQTESTAGGDFVLLTTNQIVREPYLSFILETRWSNGRLLSEHTILLDLPVFQNPTAVAPAPVRAPISAILAAPTPANTADSPRPQSQSQSQSREPSQSVQPILEPEVISAPATSGAEQAPPASDDAAPAEQLQPLAQTQEVDSETADAIETEVAETETAASQLSEPEPVVPEQVEPEETVEASAQEAIPEPQEAAEPVAEELVPEAQSITSSDSETLSDIALRVRPNQSVSVQQTMLAIQELNPDAFIGGNINRLRSGQVLTVPSLADIQAIDQRQAIDEVARQNRQIAQVDVQPLAAPANAAPTQEPANGQLSVVTGEADSEEPADGSSSSDLDRRIAELETQLALREEEADRARLEKEEMQSRLAELDQQIAAAQEIIRLQDLQLAQLQQSFADAAAEAELAAQQAAAIAQLDVPETPIRQPSLLDTLLSNSMLLIAAAVVLVVGLVMFLLRRNKSADSADEQLDELDEEEFSGVTDKKQRDGNKEESGSEFQDYNDADLDSELDDILSVGSDAKGKAPRKQPDVLLDTTNVEDVCAQADSLLAQDNVKQAENLVRAAIEENPQNDQLSLKLLAVIAAKGDLSAFEMLADELHSLQDPAIDKEVNALRSDLAIDGAKTATFTGKTASASQQDKDDTASFLDDLGIDLDAFGDDSFELADDPEPEAKPASKQQSISFADLPDDPEPEDMDITFDFADDPVQEQSEESVELDLESLTDSEVLLTPVAADSDDVSSADSLETLDFDEENDEAAVLSTGASKDAVELEIDTLDFDSPSAAEENVEPSPVEEDLELETFEFDAPLAPSNDTPAEPEPEPDLADENGLDFDFDKSELEPAPQARESDEELETFDFDLKTSTDTVVEKTDSEEISFDLDEEVELDEPVTKVAPSDATVVEPQTSSKDFDFDLSELEVDPDDVEEDLEISLTDDDFLDLGEDEDPLEVSTEPDDEDDLIEFDFDDELPASQPVTASDGSSLDDDDLNFLTDDDDEKIDVSAISIDDNDDDTYAMSDEDETATKLELAYAYQKMGDAEGAKEILQEVIREGTESQVKEANVLIKTIENSID
ncbi:MAG: pilus assembly protein FimV [Pseudohongiellaceae bacterium]|jgi:pilus assembly protein FimV